MPSIVIKALFSKRIVMYISLPLIETNEGLVVVGASN